MSFAKIAQESAQKQEPKFQSLSRFCRCVSLQMLPSTPQYRLLYVVSGKGKLSFGDSVIPLSAHSLCLLAPPHQASLEWEEGGEVLLVTFSPLALTEEGISGLTTLCKRLFFAENPPKAVEECLYKIEAAGELPQSEKKLLTKLALTELLLHLQMYAAVVEGEEKNQPLSVRVKQYLDQNLTSPQPLDDLAKRFFVSKYYLCRSFKADFGVSVHHYLSSRRVDLACRLISGGETASAAAYHVGFGDYSAFYRAYKKHKGQAPSQEPKSKDKERGNT